MSSERHLKIWTFSTFFYLKFACKGYHVVRKWTCKVEVFSQDIIVILVHPGDHWMAVIVLHLQFLMQPEVGKQ
jgi:Ulp1 family protease